MSDSNHNWSLFNKEEKLRIDDLCVEQIRTILLAVPSSRMASWFAWRDGDMSWQNIADFPEFFEDARISKEIVHAPIKSVDNRRPIFEEAPPQTETDIEEIRIETGLGLQNFKVKERRSARRYPRNLTFHVDLTTGGIFECGTEDISVSGISLDTVMPSSLPKTFSAALRWNEIQIKILCNKVNERSVKILETSNWELLKQWLVSW